MQVTETHIMAREYCVAIVNDDWSGLSGEDSILLTDFLEQFAGWYWIESSEVDFAKCEVSGLMADCLNITRIEQE